MKSIILLFFFMSGVRLAAQDTINVVPYYDGSKNFWIVTKTDTTLIALYPNGKKESKRIFKNGNINGTYQRWYENGKLMWQKELVKGKENGSAKYYDQSGIKVAELNYEDGKIKDTLFVKKGFCLVLGKLTYRSVVYGGMQREDGSSNVSDHSGNYQNYKMNAVYVDSLQKPKLIQEFKSDMNGDYFVIVKKGYIGFFPATIPIEKIKPGEFYPPQTAGMSTEGGWNHTQPLKITNQIFVVYNMHHYSVGYAP